MRSSHHRPIKALLNAGASVALLAVAAHGAPVSAQQMAGTGDALRDGFRDPPNSARPRVWWHWMNGNVTKDGIDKDLDWLARVGIGGVQNFDANLATPQIVEQRLTYMTPGWKDAFRHAVTTARAKGMDFAIAASPGWSETGGPWVQPGDGMKKLVWSEIDLAGGKRFRGSLPVPPSVTGPFQNAPIEDEMAAFSGNKAPPPPTYHADIAVLAYRIAKGALDTPAQVMVNGEAVDGAVLIDRSYAERLSVLPGTATDPSIIQLRYARSQTVRSATLFIPDAAQMFFGAKFKAGLEVSDDGGDWRKVADIPLAATPTTVSFAATTGRFFRLLITPNSGGGFGVEPASGVDLAAALGDLMKGPSAIDVAELRLSSEARVDQFETKAGFSLAMDYYKLGTPGEADGAIPRPGDVIDLTARMTPQGTLDWTPPAGQWRIVRLGYSLTGKMNHPATAEATGLEVDKYDGRAVRAYLDHYLGLYRDAVGPELIGSRGIDAIVTDSIEVGASNWTPGLIDRFRQLRGYDPTPFLPTMTGAIIGSRTQSDAFLYDFRRTLADMIATDHYGTVAKVAHENGLKVYGEALESGRPSLGDDIDMRRFADIPMGAFWTFGRDKGPSSGYRGDTRGASSTAHFYGQSLVAAESMTSAMQPWAHAPADLRRVIDMEFLEGINRPVIHSSVHQPLDDKLPGLSLQIFGQYLNRHESWAGMARPWIDYIARSSYLLQQGHNVADVAFFTGEEAPISAQSVDHPMPGLPTGHAYDFVSASGVLDGLKVDQGDLVSPGGARYRVLYLGGTSSRMTLPLLRKLEALASAGATIIGMKPAGSPSLPDDRQAFAALADRLWSGQPLTLIGNGRIIASDDLDAALAGQGIRPDFDYDKPDADSQILFVHRQSDDADIYFVSNRKDASQRINARFRVAGAQPEIWRADTGAATRPQSHVQNGDTVVPLTMGPEESYFVIFRKQDSKAAAEPDGTDATRTMTIDGPWSVSFQSPVGAPPAREMKALASLSEQADPALRYFSGTTTYRKTVTLTKVAPGATLLDLGRIGDIAEVRVNGVLAGTAWHDPYRLDISRLLRKGRNDLDIRVANLWVNRLIGDAQPGAKKVTFTAMPTYTKDAPLRPAGLIGPVTITMTDGGR